MAVKTVTTILFRATGIDRDGKPINQVKRVSDTLWKKVKGEKGMADWLKARDPRYSDDVDVTFLRNENVKPEDVTKRPELAED